MNSLRLRFNVRSTVTAFTAAILLLTPTLAVAQPQLPDFSAAVFDNSLQIDNPFFPLVPRTNLTYDKVITDPMTGEFTTEVVLVKVLGQTKTVAGIEARVVHDRVWSDGLLIEDTFDWYAQDNAGNVWYLGEDVTDFHYDDNGSLIGTSHPGAWETGVDGALPGHIMPADPQVGDHFYQEFYQGIAEDHARIEGVGETHTIPLGTFANVLHTRDFTLDPANYGDKFFAPGIGGIMERDFDAATGTLLGVSELRSVTVPEPGSGTQVAVGVLVVLLAVVSPRMLLRRK